MIPRVTRFLISPELRKNCVLRTKNYVSAGDVLGAVALPTDVAAEYVVAAGLDEAPAALRVDRRDRLRPTVEPDLLRATADDGRSRVGAGDHLEGAGRRRSARC